MLKGIIQHKFHLFESSPENMYRFDPYSRGLLEAMYSSKKSIYDPDLIRAIDLAFHDTELIKTWISFVYEDHLLFRKKEDEAKSYGDNKITASGFIRYLESSLRIQGFLSVSKLPKVKRLLNIRELMNLFAKGQPFLDVPGVEATREINDVHFKIKHSAFPHLLQLSYLHFCKKKYTDISVQKIKSLFERFSRDQAFLENIYIALFDNVGIHKNFTNPHYISHLGKLFFDLPSNYHEFLFSDLAKDYFGSHLNQLRKIEKERIRELVYYIFPKDMDGDFLAKEFKEDACSIAKINSGFIVFDIEFFLYCVDNKKPLDACFAHFEKYHFPVHGVYRSYIIGTKYYKILYDYLKINHNILLINSPRESREAHLIPNWKNKVKDYFSDTYCFPFDPKKDSIAKLVQRIRSDKMLLRNKFILKDYNKSEKEHWLTCCYIDLSHPYTKIKKQFEDFLYWRGRNFEGGICMRKYVDYPVVLENNPGSDYPRHYEFRVFVCRGKILKMNKRHSDLNYSADEKGITRFFNKVALASVVKTTFFAFDIVKKETGNYDIIEIDDAQFCGVFEHKYEFYRLLNASILNKRNVH